MTVTGGEDDSTTRLLAEALRRGPGSPEWHDARAMLRDRGRTDDEAEQWLLARERLGEGREYRSVRAGPQFTADVMSQIDAPAERPRRGWLGFTIIAACVLAAGVSAFVLVNRISRDPSGPPSDLAQVLFIRPLHQYSFLQPQSVGFELDKTWKIDRAAGIRPAAATNAQRLALPKPLDLQQPTCVECVLDVPRGADARVALIATADPPGSAAPVEIEFAHSGTTAGAGGNTGKLPRATMAGAHVLRLKLAANQAIAELDGKPVWTGPTAIAGSARIAVEFRGVTREGQSIRVEAVRVLGAESGRAKQ